MPKAEKQKEKERLLEGGKINGAHAMWRSLLAHGVDTTFGYVGGANIPTFIALNQYLSHINHYNPLHEQGGIHAAEGYARMSRRPGIVVVTSGPGALNMVTGLQDAYSDSTPIVAITGQVATHVIGTEAFQEADVIGITRKITKWNCQIKDPGEIPEIMSEAFYQATSGRPGPVLVDFPKDIQLAETFYGKFTAGNSPAKPLVGCLQREQFRQAATLLNESQKPLIIAGHGVLISGASPELMEIAERANIPVTNTLLGKSAFPDDHPLSKGMLGMHGHLSPNALSGQADLVLAVGMRFDDRVVGKPSGFLPNARIIHIDIDRERFEKISANGIKPAEIAICADAKTALKGILEGLEKRDHQNWLDQFIKMDKIEFEEVTKSQLYPSSPILTQSEVIHALSQTTSGKAVIVADVGQHQMFAAQRYKSTLPNTFITSGGLGTMGYALPAAIGAKIASPEKEVIAVVGDGSFQMTSQELGMVKRYKIPIGIIIMKNGVLGMVRQWQDLFDGDQSGVILDNPDFIRLTSSYDIPSERVTHRDNLQGALDRMRASTSSGTPYLIDAEVENAENVFPMVPAGHRTSQDVRLR